MPKVRAVDEMNESELRAELVSLLADGREKGFAERQLQEQLQRSLVQWKCKNT